MGVGVCRFLENNDRRGWLTRGRQSDHRGRMTAEQAIDHPLGSMDNEVLNELNELLRAKPMKILPMLRFARKASVGATEVEPDSESDSYRKLGSPKDFLKEYMRSLDPSLAGLTSEKPSRCEKSLEGTEAAQAAPDRLRPPEQRPARAELRKAVAARRSPRHQMVQAADFGQILGDAPRTSGPSLIDPR